MKIDINDKFREECGIVGILSKKKFNLSSMMFYSLNSLQHRGQESCGITYSDGEKLVCQKDMGLVSEVFSKNNLKEAIGFSAIGHVRYSTYGESTITNAQPILDDYTYGQIALAHNGNLTNAAIIKKHLTESGFKFNTGTDSEVILKLIQKKYDSSIEKTLKLVANQITGGYAVVILTKDSLYAMRDTNGIRPLCIGKFNDGYIVCSESCALDIVGGEFIRDVYPGEIIKISKDGIETINSIKNPSCHTCAFEYIYFARQDSVIDGISVYKSRLKAGELLYKECPADGDIVVGIPDSGIAAALGYSKASSIPYETGFVRNNFIGRTFISPLQNKREEALTAKLNVIKGNVQGKRVIVVDDSIVRGTTCKKIISLLKEAGAKEIHFRLASPIIKSPCYLGINTKCKKELIGSSMSVEEINDYIGANSLGYISIEGLLTCLRKETACLKCFK